MNMIDVEEARRQEIKTDLTHNIFVEAGAGAGKTSILVSRIMNQLKSGLLTVDQIVAITFTNKAAQELKERIGDKLRDEFNNADGATKENLGKALRNLDLMQISTIHSFCFRLLMEKIFHTGMRMDIRLLDDEERQNKVEDFFHQWYKNLPYDVISRFKENFDHKKREVILGNTFSAICEMDEHVVIEYEKHLVNKTLSDYEAIFTQRRKQYESLLLSELEQAIGFKYSSVLEAIETNDENGLFIAKFSSFYRDGKSDKDFVVDTYCEKVKAVKACSLLKLKRDKAQAINDNVREIAYHNFDANALVTELIAYQNALIIDMALKCREEYRKHFDNQEITNDVLLQKARDLVVNDADARAAFAKKYRCIYVDEFQDTDHIQTELLFALCSDENGGLREGSLFVVGDPKQSIYRFRGADLPLYYETRDRMKNMGGCKFYSLNYNFRSNEELVSFVNKNNENLLDGYEAMISKSDSSQENIPDRVLAGVYHLGSPCETSKEYNRAADVDLLVDIVSGLVEKKINIWDKPNDKYRPIEYRDFLVLCYSTNKMEDYMSALLKAGIPVQISGAIDISKSVELHRFLALYKYLAFPNYKRTREAARQAIMFEIINDNNVNIADEKLSNLLDDTKSLDGAGCAYYLSRHLEYLLDKEDELDVNVLLRFQAQLQQMIESVLKDYSNNRQDMAEAFSQFIEEGIDRELTLKEDSNTVRFMNVHKAKGLEGRIVVVCKRSEEHTYKESSYQEKGLDGKYHLYPSIAVPTGPYSAKSFSSYVNNDEIKLRSEEAEIKEYHRLDYVEVTRAMEAVIFLDVIKKNAGFMQYDFTDTKNLRSEFDDIFNSTQTGDGVVKESAIDYDKSRNDVVIDVDQSEQQAWHLSPSALENYVPAPEDSLDDRPKGNLFGTVMHRCYELMVAKMKVNAIDVDVQKQVAIQAVMEFMDDLKDAFDNNAMEVAETYLDYLVKLLEKFVGDKKILDVLNSDATIYTELPFSIYVSQDVNVELFKAIEEKVSKEKLEKLLPSSKNQRIWINGKADLVAVYPDGRIKVIDYKSDYLGNCNADDAFAIINKRYSGQMELYRQVLAIIFNTTVDKVAGEFYLI